MLNPTANLPNLSVFSTQFGSSDTLQPLTFLVKSKSDDVSIISASLTTKLFVALSVNCPLIVTSLLSVLMSSFRKVGPPKLDGDDAMTVKNSVWLLEGESSDHHYLKHKVRH